MINRIHHSGVYKKPNTQKGTHIYERNITQIKSHIETHTSIVGDMNIPLFSVGWSSKQKLNKEIMEVKEVMNKMNQNSKSLPLTCDFKMCILSFQ